MKAPILALLLTAAALAGAQPFTVLLNNPEETDFYFTLDPPELKSFDPSASVFPNVVYDYFGETPPPNWAGFQPLPAGATRRLENLAEGTHLVVGFFAPRSRREFPVRTLTVKAGGGMSERFYSVYTEPSLFKARAGRGRLAAFAPPEEAAAAPATAAVRPPGEGRLNIRIDNQYQDWEVIPALAAFGDYQPESFSREQYGSAARVLPLREARFWQKAGTSLAELKAVREDKTLYLFLSTRSAIADGLSIFLYFHDPKDPADGNRVTLELLPAAKAATGLAVLWVKDRSPVAAGTLASGSFFLEASVDLAKIEAALISRSELTSVELTTCYRDRNALAYEEFYYATLALPDFPTADRLYAPKD
jgi:hypothetical protein